MKYPLWARVPEGCLIPWYMGYAYTDFYRYEAVFVLLPFHWLLRFVRWAWWAAKRCCPMRWEQDILDIRREGYCAGYTQGEADGMKKGEELLIQKICACDAEVMSR